MVVQKVGLVFVCAAVAWSGEVARHGLNEAGSPGRICQKKFVVDRLEAPILAPSIESKTELLDDVGNMCDLDIRGIELVRSTLQGSPNHGIINQDAQATVCVKDLALYGDVLVLATFDGHGVDGHGVAEFAAKELEPALQRVKAKTANQKPETLNLPAFLSEALVDIQNRVKEKQEADSQTPELSGGSTAILVGVGRAVNRAGLVFGMASLGDSQASLYTLNTGALASDVGKVLPSERRDTVYNAREEFGPNQNVREPGMGLKIAERFHKHGYTGFSAYGSSPQCIVSVRDAAV
eukprot:Protomagalhaensia_wolfi_Nauph_80__2923@NODE_2_length_7647_cov_170_632755_g1_i0_p4_GENE_NODE_2_length_7647_cov_170_632755_g1_i0NODE_2_length_7647_cov_170_632755_g1_i0_p4_ORF_typecomplete_len294_score38_11PP2C/PF00481_21/1e09DUF3209/PF11483_8/0_3_NODE_2_length_7647_cov_170_632755_g1_i057686649